MQTRTGSAVLVLSLAACGAPPGSPVAPAGETAGMCPMQGTAATTRATAVDTSDGVALVFTTTRYVDDLRARVRAMATVRAQMPKVPSTAAVEDVPGGARIVFAATDPAHIPALREHVHAQARTMDEGRCPGMAPPPKPLPPEVKDELEMIEEG